MLAVGFFLAIPAMADVVYSTMPSPIPPNVPSLGYQATQTAEFGQGVDLSTNGATLGSAQVLMSDWALESTYETVGTSTGFTVPLTLNLYNLGPADSVGSLITSTTMTQQLPGDRKRRLAAERPIARAMGIATTVWPKW